MRVLLIALQVHMNEYYEKSKRLNYCEFHLNLLVFVCTIVLIFFWQWKEFKILVSLNRVSSCRIFWKHIASVIMIHGTFPLAKFRVLLFKQIARPIHKKIVSSAKSNTILRKRVCIPLAESFHELDVRIRFFHEDWSKIKK